MGHQQYHCITDCIRGTIASEVPLHHQLHQRCHCIRGTIVSPTASEVPLHQRYYCITNCIRGAIASEVPLFEPQNFLALCIGNRLCLVTSDCGMWLGDQIGQGNCFTDNSWLL